MRKLVEHGIDHAGFLLVDKGAGNVDIFGRHDARRHVGAAGELVGPGAQHRAQHRLDAFERPAAGQRRVDLRIEPLLLAQNALDDIAKIGRLRRPILHAFDFAAEPMLFELGHDLVHAGAGEIHLIERLHRGEPGGAALVGLARFLGVVGHHRFPSRRLMRDQSKRGARGIAAFILLLGAGARPGLRFAVDGDDAVADRDLARHRKLHQSARGLVRDDLEMNGVAADDAAERDGAVIGAAARRGIERDRMCRRDFQRSLARLSNRT